LNTKAELLPASECPGECSFSKTEANRTKQRQHPGLSRHPQTCGHCVGAVISDIKDIDGVTVDLVTDGTSTMIVTSKAPSSEYEIWVALDEVGDCQLTERVAVRRRKKGRRRRNDDVTWIRRVIRRH
jgi:copper chaperone CopZ